MKPQLMTFSYRNKLEIIYKTNFVLEANNCKQLNSEQLFPYQFLKIDIDC